MSVAHLKKPYKPKHELADVLNLHLADYIAHFGLTHQQSKVLNAIRRCRTAEIGSHREIRCDNDACDYHQIAYNSCRNRHCPKCQGLHTRRWISDRQDDLLPIEYFHWVFTLPHILNSLVNQGNEKVIYNLLYRVINETLQSFSNKKWQSEIGIIMVLHTWGQKLNQHIHMHCIVTGGALRLDKTKFIRCPHNYLFPVKAVQKVYAAKFMSYLTKAYDNNELQLSDKLPSKSDYFLNLMRTLKGLEWVVYAKKSFSSPDSVIKYLGRYTHKVAISNHRLIDVTNESVTFQYKDYKDDSKSKQLCLAPLEFIRLFMLHILPFRFVRIRHYGLLACGHRFKKLNIARILLGIIEPYVKKERLSDSEFILKEFGRDVLSCPKCKTGHLLSSLVFRQRMAT